MKVIKKQDNSHDCIICGMDNPLGLQAPFYETEENTVVTKFKFRNEHQSYPGRAHGGMICALLDELVGRAIWITEPNMWGVTISLNIKYRKPVPLETELIGIGEIISETSRTFNGKGTIKDKDGNVLAEAEAVYMKLPLEKIAEGSDSHDVMFAVPDNVTEI